MGEPMALLDIAAARRLVREYVGQAKEVTACWQPPEGLYRAVPEDDDCIFYFAILDSKPAHVGGTPHVAVDRRTGEITDLGRLGE